MLCWPGLIVLSWTSGSSLGPPERRKVCSRGASAGADSKRGSAAPARPLSSGSRSLTLQDSGSRVTYDLALESQGLCAELDSVSTCIVPTRLLSFHGSHSLRVGFTAKGCQGLELGLWKLLEILELDNEEEKAQGSTSGAGTCCDPSTGTRAADRRGEATL